MEKIREKVGASFFWSRFDEALELRDESLAGLCKRIGVSNRTLYSQRFRESMPDDKMLSLLSSSLGVSKSWLLTGLDPIEYEPEIRQVVDVLAKDHSKLHVVRVVLGLE